MRDHRALPPILCLSLAGFGTHEWVSTTISFVTYFSGPKEERRIGDGETGINNSGALEPEITRLEKLKTEWLEQPQEDTAGGFRSPHRE